MPGVHGSIPSWHHTLFASFPAGSALLIHGWLVRGERASSGGWVAERSQQWWVAEKGASSGGWVAERSQQWWVAKKGASSGGWQRGASSAFALLMDG